MINIKNQILVVCDKPGKNGRIYSSDTMLKEIEKCNNFSEHMNNIYEIYGRYSNDDTCEIGLCDISHRVKNLNLKDGVVYGDIDILDTPKGKFIQEILNQQNLGFKMIGWGVVDCDGNVNDYNLGRFDICNLENSAYEESKIKYNEKICK